jgi:glycerol-3-phosphate O-acyltransferase
MDHPSGQPDEKPEVGMLPRSAMHDRYASVTRRIMEWLFGPIQYPEAAAETIRQLAKLGTIVYVARARTSLLGLYFNHALQRFGLPLAHFVAGISLLLWQPIDRMVHLLQQRRRAPDGPWRARYPERTPRAAESLLIEVCLRGGPAFLFLRPPREHGVLGRAHKNDYMRALVVAQRYSEKPIFLIPHVLAGKAQAGSVRGTLGLRVLGTGRRAASLQELVLLLSPQRGSVRVADPIRLDEILEASPEADDLVLGRKLSHELNRRMDEEERVVAGPSLPAYDQTERHVLRAPEVRAQLEQQSQETKRPLKSLERRAKKLLSEIAARYNVHVIRLVGVVLRWIFNRIYDGIVVDEDGLARTLEAARRGPLVFCPSHKSHIDYLVMSYILWQHGVAPPHIAAGANLSFFPLGTIFRRTGAFFLRRTFKDDPLYRAVFRSYVAETVRTGASIEFFLEGTRSRTGKLLPPKFGLLGMLADAWRQKARDDLQFVPVSIDYERIIEAGSYEKELKGGEKRPEDLGALLSATRVLRSRYGRVHVQFGTPLSLAEFAKGRNLPQDDNPVHDDTWREAVARLGYRVLYEVSQVCTVTPTAVVATALLGHRGRGLSQSALVASSLGIIEYLEIATARLSETLIASDRRAAAVLEAIQRLVDEGAVRVDRAGRADTEPIYHVPDDNRLVLDFHKNALMNYFAPAALIARVLQATSGVPQYEAVHKDTRFLSRLFKREFLYRVDATYDTHFDDTLATMAVRGLLDVNEDGTITVREPLAIALLAALLDGYVQAYSITAETLFDLRKFPLWDKELSVRALERARRAFLEGTISRPEAAGRTIIDSAIGWFIEVGVLEQVSEGRRKRLQLASSYQGPALDELAGAIARYR